MTAEEIHNMLYTSETPSGFRLGPEGLRTYMLGEIAIQLALLNDRLASWSWPDGNSAITTK